MDEQIPPLRRPEDTPPIRTQADLHRQWRALMGPLGFSDHSLWVLFLDREGDSHGLLTRIEELPERPEEPLLANLMDMCRHIVWAEGSVAFLLTGPGRAGITGRHRTWGRLLLEAARRAAVPCEPIHVADDQQLTVLAWDDLDLTG
jgi:hypothetical protein